MHPRPRLILPRAASCSIPTTRPSLRLAVCVCSLARACLFAQPTSEDAHHPSQPRNLVNFVRMGGGRQPRHDPCAPATAHRSEEGPAEVTAARTDAAVPVRAGARSIHGVPRRRPSRDSLTLLPERAAACPLTVRRVWRSVVEGWAEDFSRHGAGITDDAEVRGLEVRGLPDGHSPVWVPCVAAACGGSTGFGR
jgi:hypothetical protein